MKYLINIVSEQINPKVFKKQMPFDNDLINYKLNCFDNDIIWDMVLFWLPPKEEYNFKIKNGASVFMAGEPKLMQKYSLNFLKQFKYTITSYSIKKLNHFEYPPYNPWFYGYDYTNKKLNLNSDQIRCLKPPVKDKVMSVITSQKNFMPDHQRRLNFINELKKRHSNQIDFYGYGGKELKDKAEGINSYKFHLCFENSSSNTYWTEKLMDPILGYSLPVYYGCKNIETFFEKGIIKIDLNNFQKSLIEIDNILSNSEFIYEKMKADLVVNRNKILNEYNLISFTSSFFLRNVRKQLLSVDFIKINSFNSFNSNIFLNFILRFQRLFGKIISLISYKVKI